MRKHVMPADPAATIPDPTRGRPLPPDGLTVTWGPYWAGLEARGDILAVELSDEAADAPGEPAAPPEAMEPTPARKGAKPAA